MLILENMLDEFTPDMAPKLYTEYVETEGSEALYKLAKMFGGQKIYVPKESNVFAKLIKKKVIQDYEIGGYTHESLAEKYSLCPKTVGRYLQEARAKKPI